MLDVVEPLLVLVAAVEAETLKLTAVFGAFVFLEINLVVVATLGETTCAFCRCLDALTRRFADRLRGLTATRTAPGTTCDSSVSSLS